jgi:hypothetical protein
MATEEGSVLSDMPRREATARWAGWVVNGAIIALFLGPPIRIAEGIPAVRLEDILLFGGSAVLLAYWSLGGRIRLAWGLRQTLLAGFAVFVPLSILSGALQDYPAALGDLNQWIRLLKYVLIYTAVATFVRVGDGASAKRRWILDLVVISSVLLAAVAVQQFFDLFGLNSMYVAYVAPTQAGTLLGQGGIPRPVGLAGNPNELGFLFALGALVSTYSLLAHGGKRYWASLAVQLVGLLLTLSRSSVLALLGGSAALLLLSGTLRRWLAIEGLGRTVGALALGGAVVLGAAWQTGYLSEAAVRLAGLLNPTETSAYRIRIAHWQENISLFLESPLLGVGPLRQTEFIRYAADNEYLLLLRMYGLVGTLYLGAVFLLPQLPMVRFESNRGVAMDRAALLADSVLVACMIYMVPAATFHSLVLMPAVLVLLATGDWTLRPYTVSVTG